MSKEDISIINIIYKYEKNMNIFGSEFVKNNKNICKMIINNNEYEITDKFSVEIVEIYDNNKLKIKLKGIDNVTDMIYIFYECESLTS